MCGFRCVALTETVGFSLMGEMFFLGPAAHPVAEMGESDLQ